MDGKVADSSNFAALTSSFTWGRPTSGHAWDILGAAAGRR